MTRVRSHVRPVSNLRPERGSKRAGTSQYCWTKLALPDHLSKHLAALDRVSRRPVLLARTYPEELESLTTLSWTSMESFVFIVIQSFRPYLSGAPGYPRRFGHKSRSLWLP